MTARVGGMGYVPDWAIGVAIIILAASFSRVLPALLRGRAQESGQPDGEAARLRSAVEDVEKRMGELEERVDFAERLLAKQRDGERLGGGKENA